MWKKVLQIIMSLWSVTSNKEDNTPVEVIQAPTVDIQVLYKTFPHAKKEHIDAHYPLLVKSLQKRDILSQDMVIYCLATLEVENPWWKGVLEKASKWSTKNKRKPYDFSKYVGMLGNKDIKDATRYRGAGWIQLTGRSNFQDMDNKLGLNGKLVENPELALLPEYCAEIFAIYMADRMPRIEPALKERNYVELRKVVNGGTHGLQRFVKTFKYLDENLFK